MPQRKEYKCEFCNRLFKDNYNLNTHRYTTCLKFIDKTKENLTEFKCEYCQKIYYSKKRFNFHVKRTHLNHKTSTNNTQTINLKNIEDDNKLLHKQIIELKNEVKTCKRKYLYYKLKYENLLDCLSDYESD